MQHVVTALTTNEGVDNAACWSVADRCHLPIRVVECVATNVIEYTACGFEPMHAYVTAPEAMQHHNIPAAKMFSTLISKISCSSTAARSMYLIGIKYTEAFCWPLIHFGNLCRDTASDDRNSRCAFKWSFDRNQQ